MSLLKYAMIHLYKSMKIFILIGKSSCIVAFCFIISCMCGHPHMLCRCTFTCLCEIQMLGNLRSHSAGIIHMFFESVSLYPGTCQQASEICLSLPPQSWNYKYDPSQWHFKNNIFICFFWKICTCIHCILIISNLPHKTPITLLIT